MLLIDKYAYFNRLKNAHPLEKMILALSLLLFSLAVKDVFVSLITFTLMSAFIIFGAKIPISYYLKLLLLPGFFLLSGTFTILFSFSSNNTSIPNVWLSWNVGSWQIFISEDSIKTVISLIVVVLSSISCLYFLTLTTPITAILHVLRKLKLPSLLIDLVELTYRFIFIFLETAMDIYQSQSSRLGYSTMRRGIRSLGMLISALFLGVFQRSKQLTMAMNARGYQEDISFIEDSYRFSPINWLITIGILVSLIITYILVGGSL
ncbi:cobalt ECF transporter T component CbiQ [Peribacillus cavernae]|uniref:Cobalt ECF transporter T component CbiQ n=1 Tax=Peribacillus cavernae TaxID=1674310 RepID=A0A433HQH8_9BACI|nr:cobalt ECF transporter T component CbiQ [Peribacillus cavernae]MDQ0216927.1 cobalt/nickel transport system permease protein [Peribacillus cavernae]RUQ30579.1 cobalt ECF transporter T component CbiQ [Peribacillus cavernae]